MNTNTQTWRLESLKRGLEAARDGEKLEPPASIKTQHEIYLKGLNDGVQLAIDAINWELLTIAAGQQQAAAVAQPQ